MSIAVEAERLASAMAGEQTETRWAELVAVALAAGERDEARLRSHVARALDLGASQAEVVSVIRVAFVLCGVPSLRSGLRVLLAALVERGESA